MKQIILVYLLLFISSLSGTRLLHNCIHDNAPIIHRVTAKQEYKDHPFSQVQSEKRDSVQTWSPIRFYVDFHDFNSTGSFRDFIALQVMPAATSYLSTVLSVIPVQGHLLLNKRCYRYYVNPYRCIDYFEPTTCGQIVIPDEHLAEKNGIGVDADYIIYVTDSSASGNTLAFASACQFDQYDRPIAGYVHFTIPSNIDYSKTSTLDTYVDVATHEMIHALGFSSQLFPTFKDSTGKTYANSTIDVTERGETVTKLITPNALKYGREYFGCDSLNGVELENQGGSGTVKSHLEMRIFIDALMTGATLEGRYTSIHPVTMGIFEDSGWYKSNYSATKDQYWGKNLGCSFATEKCINDGKTDTNYYCTSESGKRYCHPNRRQQGFCNLASYTTNLPTQFQYFSNPNLGGRWDLADFCPVYGDGFSNCWDPSNSPSINYWGESYNADSRCLESTLIDSSYNRYYVPVGTGCYEIRCNGEYSFEVKVKNDWITCAQPGKVTISGFRGELTCPTYQEVCE